MKHIPLWLIKKLFKWIGIPIVLFGLASAILYLLVTPKQDRNWTEAHAVLAKIEFQGDQNNPDILVKNIRDFQWQAEDKDNDQDKDQAHYKNMKFQLQNVVELKAVVSHFSTISEIAHVFMIFVLDDGRELGVSVEARREQGEEFSIQGGLLAQFEIMYVLATPDDLLGIRKINKESVHIYPIKETREKAQELFMLIANEINALAEKPRMYHLFFKNCTNQLVKNVSILTERQYPWYFQTLAPGLTGRTLFELDLIDMPESDFKDIQVKTLVKG